MKQKSLGALGERLALKFLKNKGYRFIESNFRSTFGEIDLIFQDKKTLVLVEVKTRFSDFYGKPEEAITPRKINTIIKTGEYFSLINKFTGEMRVDVVAIMLNNNSLALKSLKHFQNITL